MALILAMAIAAGLVRNRLLEKPLPLFGGWQRAVVASDEKTKPFPELDVDTVRALLEKGDALLLDARHVEAYRAGHIPGAISLPVGHFDEIFASLKMQLAGDKMVISSCSDPGCPDSIELAKRLREKGLTQVWLFRGGVAAWQERGFDLEEQN